MIGVAAAVIGPVIQRLALFLKPYADKWTMLVVPLAGIAVAVLAIIYAEATGKPTSDVLLSGENALDPLITHAASYSVGALLLLLVCKGLAYAVSLSSFRGGPVFPAMFMSTTSGIALSHLPGLPMIAGVAMGIGAMSVVMLTLPITSVLLATLLLASDGLALMPLVIVAVVVAYVAAARITPAETTGSATRRPPPRGQTVRWGLDDDGPDIDHHSGHGRHLPAAADRHRAQAGPCPVPGNHRLP